MTSTSSEYGDMFSIIRCGGLYTAQLSVQYADFWKRGLQSDNSCVTGPRLHFFPWFTWGCFGIFGSPLSGISMLKRACQALTFSFPSSVTRVIGCPVRGHGAAHPGTT